MPHIHQEGQIRPSLESVTVHNVQLIELTKIKNEHTAHLYSIRCESIIPHDDFKQIVLLYYIRHENTLIARTETRTIDHISTVITDTVAESSYPNVCTRAAAGTLKGTCH